MALTKAQRARLDKLATYLEKLPRRYRHFEMSTYFRGLADGPVAETDYARKNGGVNNCNTVACAVGHGPAAGMLVPKRFVGNDRVDWSGYESAMFTGPDSSGDLHAWMFSGAWAEIDNHHYGAAARIRYLLDQGTPPEEWDFCDSSIKLKRLYAPYRIDAKARADA